MNLLFTKIIIGKNYVFFAALPIFAAHKFPVRTKPCIYKRYECCWRHGHCPAIVVYLVNLKLQPGMFLSKIFNIMVSCLPIPS